MGNVMSAARGARVSGVVRRVGARVAALVLGGLVVAAPAQAAVQIFVSNNSTGTINEYLNGTLAGQLPAQGSSFNDLTRGVELGPDKLIYTDRVSGSSIQAYSPITLAPVGAPLTLNSDGGRAFGNYSMSFGPDGSLYVAVMSNDSIQKFLPGSTTGTLLVSNQSGGLRVPMDTMVLGNTLYVSSFNQGDGTSGSVLRYNATTGAFIDTFVAAGQNGLSGPVGLALAADGSVLVSGLDSSNILKFDPTTKAFLGTFIAPGTGGLKNPADMQLNADNGDLYIASIFDNSVREYNGVTGAFVGFAVAPGAGGLNGSVYLSVSGTNAVTSGVPLPTGAWAGLVTLALFGGFAATRRKLVPAMIR
jgi:hypothetical protein